MTHIHSLAQFRNPYYKTFQKVDSLIWKLINKEIKGEGQKYNCEDEDEKNSKESSLERQIERKIWLRTSVEGHLNSSGLQSF